MSSAPSLLHSAANRAALARARGAIAEHERVFRAFEGRALRAAQEDEPLAAAGYAQIALAYGTRSHPGVLVAPALERLLNGLGREHVPDRGEPTPHGGGGERVLHVFTEAYDIGGHTRLALRWIERDVGRTPTVVLTAQTTAVPAALVEAVAGRDGRLVAALAPGDLFARAGELRRLALEHDLVVLHVHMHDVVPALALAEPAGRPPTVWVDHADHLLWIGAGVADVVANFREVGEIVAVERRGIDPTRTRVLPLPVSVRELLPDRAAARAALGIAPEVPVVLSVTSPYKVKPVIDPSFPALGAAVLEAIPDALLLVVGPVPDAAWARVSERSGGRVHVLGPSPDLGAYLAAADVFLDSWPGTGCTTVLEAASAGLPIVTLQDPEADLSMVRPDGEAISPGLFVAGSVEELAARVAELIAQPALRASIGAELRAAVDRVHDSGWVARMEEVVAAAHERAGTAAPPSDVPARTPADWECVLHLLRAADGHTWTPETALAMHASDLPASERPTDLAGLQASVATTLAAVAPERRAVAMPLVDANSVTRLVDDVRDLCARGEIGSCTVALPEDRLDEGLGLLEAALSAGSDVDLDVVVGDSLEDLARPGDLVLR